MAQTPQKRSPSNASGEALKNVVPTCVFLYGYGRMATIAPGFGIWYGGLTFKGYPDLEFVPPNPKKQTVVVIFASNARLPTGVRSGAAYLWRGGKDFVFLRAIDPKLPVEKLLGQVGLKSIGASEAGEAPF